MRCTICNKESGENRFCNQCRTQEINRLNETLKDKIKHHEPNLDKSPYLVTT